MSMRRLLVVAAAVLALPAVSPAAAPACRTSVARAPAGLPASVVLRTQCGNYTVRPDGSVARSAPAPLSEPTAFARMSKGHVVVVEHGRVKWRSHRVFRTLASPDGAVVSRRHVAFSFYNGRLWIARLDGAEQPVGRNESPLGWTHDEDLLAARWNRRRTSIYVHGERDRTRVATNVRALAFDESSATLLFVSVDGVLFRTDGRTTTPLVSLRSLGLPRSVQLEPVGAGLIALPAPDRLVVLRADGSVFASSFFSRVERRQGRLAFDSWPVAGPGGVAFTITDPDGSNSFGYENVFVLGEGSTQATRLWRAQVEYEGCGWYTTLAWHGDWLLYAAPAVTSVLAIDASGADAAVDLTRFVRSLPGVVVDQTGEGSGFVDASWSD
jgi:hypothetical protein